MDGKIHMDAGGSRESDRAGLNLMLWSIYRHPCVASHLVD